MKIAFLNRGRETHPGGDIIALDATMEALRHRGVECVETGWHSDKIKEFDLAHIWHCNFAWSWGNYEAVKQAGKKYVLTPLYYPNLLCGIERGQQRSVLYDSMRIIAFTQFERRQIEGQYFTDLALHLMGKGKRGEVVVVPCGTDRVFHDRPVAARRGVMCVSARGKGDKGVEMVEAICQRIKVPFVFPQGLSQIALANTYAGAKVFVNASGSERMSLTIGEALCAGCRVLATQENWGNEWYPGIVTFDPHNEIQLEHLIRWALHSESWDYRPNEAARTITWDWVAEKIHAVYQEVLA